jgi:hypothetical protein
MSTKNKVPNILGRGFLIIGITSLIILTSCLFNSKPKPNTIWPQTWKTYTNTKYHFSLQYPPHWHYLEVSGDDLLGALDQVLFMSDETLLDQTDVRSDITVMISDIDPSESWQSQFYENYSKVMIQLGDLTAERISGINKKSQFEERVVIIKIGEHFIQALPNFSPESLEYFDHVISSLQIEQVEASAHHPSTMIVPESKEEQTVVFEGISFTFPSFLAEGAKAQNVPAFIDPSGFMYDDHPAHVRFDFNNPYTTRGIFANFRPVSIPWLKHQNPENLEYLPQIFIYPTREYAEISPLAGERIETLRNLLDSNTLSAGSELPVLPTFNSTQDLRGQAQFLAFQGGRGLRFIARYSQETFPVINPRVFYTFQGLTDDGNLYVAAFFPLYISILPDQIEVEDWEAFNQGYQDYISDVAAKLEELNPGDFEPNLEYLDALISSMSIPFAEMN